MLFRKENTLLPNAKQFVLDAQDHPLSIKIWKESFDGINERNKMLNLLKVICRNSPRNIKSFYHLKTIKNETTGSCLIKDPSEKANLVSYKTWWLVHGKLWKLSVSRSGNSHRRWRLWSQCYGFCWFKLEMTWCPWWNIL